MDATEQITEVKRIDSSGRISLGRQFANKHVRVSRAANGDFVITPVAIIPEAELWAWENPEVLAQLRQGLKESAAGETHSLGSFSQYADEADE